MVCVCLCMLCCVYKFFQNFWGGVDLLSSLHLLRTGDCHNFASWQQILQEFLGCTVIMLKRSFPTAYKFLFYQRANQYVMIFVSITHSVIFFLSFSIGNYLNWEVFRPYWNGPQIVCASRASSLRIHEMQSSSSKCVLVRWSLSKVPCRRMKATIVSMGGLRTPFTLPWVLADRHVVLCYQLMVKRFLKQTAL